MRLIVGVDSDGHQYAIKADTMEHVRKYILERLGENWHYGMATELKARVKAHPSNDSLLSDTKLVYELYSRDIFTGPTSAYADTALDRAVKILDSWTAPMDSLIAKVNACQTEEELLDSDIMDLLYDYDVFWGRDIFTELYDPLGEE